MLSQYLSVIATFPFIVIALELWTNLKTIGENEEYDWMHHLC